MKASELIAGAKPVTAWLRWHPPEKNKKGDIVKPGYWDYNHFEEGHSQLDNPLDAFPQRGWVRATWRKAHGWLVPQASGSPRLDYPKEGLFE